jgi:hypothetical protein
MLRVISILLASFLAWFESRLAMQMELIALRHQVADKDIVACDFFTVPTANFKVLFVFISNAKVHDRVLSVYRVRASRAQLNCCFT